MPSGLDPQYVPGPASTHHRHRCVDLQLFGRWRHRPLHRRAARALLVGVSAVLFMACLPPVVYGLKQLAQEGPGWVAVATILGRHWRRCAVRATATAARRSADRSRTVSII